MISEKITLFLREFHSSITPFRSIPPKTAENKISHRYVGYFIFVALTEQNQKPLFECIRQGNRT